MPKERLSLTNGTAATAECWTLCDVTWTARPGTVYDVALVPMAELRKVIGKDTYKTGWCSKPNSDALYGSGALPDTEAVLFALSRTQPGFWWSKEKTAGSERYFIIDQANGDYWDYGTNEPLEFKK